MAIFKRFWELSVQINGNMKTYFEKSFDDNSLKIDFNIKNACGGGFANGDITITNLSNQDMEFLASCYSLKNGNLKSNKISLSAGYENNFGVICNGNFSEVNADFESVDKTINFKVVGKIENNMQNNSIQTSKEGVTNFKDICLECATKNDLGLNFDDSLNSRKLRDFSFLGSPFQYIEKIRSLYNDVFVYIDDTANQMRVEKKDKKPINTNVLSSKTGLLGKPKPTYLGCVVRSLLNPSLKAGGCIQLENYNLKSFNAQYRIQELTHRGSNKGDLWETELVLQRF